MIEEKYQHIADMALSSVEGVRRTGLRILELRSRYAKIMMPMEKNGNHIGIMYAGSLFTLGEFAGGIIYGVTFDITRWYPLVKEVFIKFKRPAVTDVTLEVSLSGAQAEQIIREAELKGRADYALELELKDADGSTVSVLKGVWQLRGIPESMKGIPA